MSHKFAVDRLASGSTHARLLEAARKIERDRPVAPRPAEPRFETVAAPPKPRREVFTAAPMPGPDSGPCMSQEQIDALFRARHRDQIVKGVFVARKRRPRGTVPPKVYATTRAEIVALLRKRVAACPRTVCISPVTAEAIITLLGGL